jgi:RNA polymerase sigma-70 factor (ECF subfamily)
VHSSDQPNGALLETLLENHRRFLDFLIPRVGSRAVAEEILQAAFLKSVTHGHTVQAEENVTAWFYRLLRNAVIDYYRKRGAETRGLELLGREEGSAASADVEAEICRCVERLIPTLKREYGEVIEAVDLRGNGLAQFAEASGITKQNATVRLHRARQALKARLEESCGTCTEHGCLSCTCSV